MVTASDLLAIDVAILPPPEVQTAAVALGAGLPAAESKGLRLDEAHLPHVTLTQHFVRRDDLDLALERVDSVLRSCPPVTIRVTGGGQGSHAVWMAVERTPELMALHERLMDGMIGLERPTGDRAAFHDADARDADVRWVAAFRVASSFEAFTPHLTLGHAARPPAIEPFSFEATTVAACHLGAFCTCRRVLRPWALAAVGLLP